MSNLNIESRSVIFFDTWTHMGTFELQGCILIDNTFMDQQLFNVYTSNLVELNNILQFFVLFRKNLDIATTALVPVNPKYKRSIERRKNDLINNRYMRRGNKENINKILTRTLLLLLQLSSNNYKDYFSINYTLLTHCYSLNISKKCWVLNLQSYTFLLQQSSKFNYKTLYTVDWLYYLLYCSAPTVTYSIHRVHKATYKHSRGKSGRYTRQIVHVKKFQRIHAFLTHLGYNINMCGQHRFFNRFLCAFNILCNNISYTYGFRFNRRAREKLVK